MRWRAAWLLVFLATLHLLVLTSIWTGSLGRVAPGVLLVSVIPLAIAGAHLLGRITIRLSWLDVWILVFGLWSVASVVLYLQPGNPTDATAYAYGVYHFVLPIACYFAVRAVPREQHRWLLNGLVALAAFAVAYGLYMHFARPAYYAAYLSDRLSRGGELQEWQYFARLQSYLGSTSVGWVCATSLVLLTLAGPRVRRLLPLLAPLFIVGAALSLQRASLLATAIALGYLAFIAPVRPWLRMVMIAAIGGTVIYGGIVLQGALSERIASRATEDMLEGLSGFLLERGYRPGFSYLQDFPLGVGIGATSSAAANAGLLTRPEVADANFMRIAADLGIEGLLAFLIVVLVAGWRAFQTPNRGAWLSILVIHCGIMLSTNVFDSYYVSHSFWILLAVMEGQAPPSRAGLSLLEGARLALARRRALLATGAGLAIAAGVFELVRPASYTARASFTLQLPQPSGDGDIGALLSQFGGAPSAGESAVIYPDVLYSRQSLTALLGLAGADARECLGVQPGTASAPAHDADLRALRRNLVVRVTRRTGVTTITATTRCPDLSAAIADSAIGLLGAFEERRHAGVAAATRAQYARRLADAEASLADAERERTAFRTRNRGAERSAPTVRLEDERLSREVDRRALIVSELARAQGDVALEAIRSTPALTTIEPAQRPGVPDERGVAAMMLAALAAGVMLAGVWMVVAAALDPDRSRLAEVHLVPGLAGGSTPGVVH